jgi:hypothetical protein
MRRVRFSRRVEQKSKAKAKRAKQKSKAKEQSKRAKQKSKAKAKRAKHAKRARKSNATTPDLLSNRTVKGLHQACIMSYSKSPTQV